MSSSAAEAFPWEVLENIVDSCHVRGEPDYATLQQVALTCHGLLPQARASLFRHVRLRTHEKLEQFLEAIEENRMLEGLVKELTITPRDTKPFFAPFASMSQRLRRLRAMSLSVDPTLSTPYHAPRTLRFTAVAFLKLSNVTFSSQGDFMRLLWMFPELRLLQLGVVEFKKKPQKSEMTPPVVRPLTGAALAKLEIVDILVRMTKTVPGSDDGEVDASRAGTKSVPAGAHEDLGVHARLAFHPIKRKKRRGKSSEGSETRGAKSRTESSEAGHRW